MKRKSFFMCMDYVTLILCSTATAIFIKNNDVIFVLIPFTVACITFLNIVYRMLDK